MLLMLLSAKAQASDFTYTNNLDGTITITGYTGPGGNITIPSTIDGLLVTRIEEEAFWSKGSLTGVIIPNSVRFIGNYAFSQCTSLTNIIIPDSVTYLGDAAFSFCLNLANVTIGRGITQIGHGWPGAFGTFQGCASLTRVTIPDNVTNIANGPIHLGGSLGAFYQCANLTNVVISKNLAYLGTGAFNYCGQLTGVYFRGHAPTPGISMFGGEDIFHASEMVILYYLPGTTGWGPTYAGRPTALWNPQAQINAGNFGVLENRFGFPIAGTPGIPLVVEAATDLAAVVWIPLQSCTLTNGLIYFSDPQWTNYSMRFYRIRSP
jgi:hypothetical protein